MNIFLQFFAFVILFLYGIVIYLCLIFFFLVIVSVYPRDISAQTVHVRFQQATEFEIPSDQRMNWLRVLVK